MAQKSKRDTKPEDLADYYRNPERYEADAQQAALVAPEAPVTGINHNQKLLSDVAYERARRGLNSSPDGAQPMPEVTPALENTQMSPQVQAQYDKEKAAKEAALRSMLLPPRGM